MNTFETSEKEKYLINMKKMQNKKEKNFIVVSNILGELLEIVCIVLVIKQDVTTNDIVDVCIVITCKHQIYYKQRTMAFCLLGSLVSYSFYNFV